MSDYSIDSNTIVEQLEYLGCGSDFLLISEEILSSDNKNIGFCYSNPYMRESVIYISKTSSRKEFLNTLFHETCHLAVHIANTDSIDKDSENFCYLAGSIGEEFSNLVLKICD